MEFRRLSLATQRGKILEAAHQDSCPSVRGMSLLWQAWRREEQKQKDARLSSEITREGRRQLSLVTLLFKHGQPNETEPPCATPEQRGRHERISRWTTRDMKLSENFHGCCTTARSRVVGHSCGADKRGMTVSPTSARVLSQHQRRMNSHLCQLGMTDSGRYSDELR